MIDTDLMLRDGTVEMNSSEATPTAIDFGGEDLVPMTYFVDVLESSDGGSETLDVVIEGSNTSASAGFETICTFPQITAVTGKAQFIKEAICNYRWRRAKITLGGDTSPSFHGVKVYACPAGRYDQK